MWEECRLWVESDPRALLVAADMSEPLWRESQILGMVDAAGRSVGGVASRFHGFSTASVSVASSDAGSVPALLEPLLCDKAILIADKRQPLPEAVTRDRAWSDDVWLTAPLTVEAKTLSRDVERIDSYDEIEGFLRKHGACFWCRSMGKLGHCYGVRRSGELVAVTAVNFILPGRSYANIGPIVTAPEWRGRGLASALLSTQRYGLMRSGIKLVGLLAEAHRQRLLEFYYRQGFVPSGRFQIGVVERRTHHP
jgi:ribosomal protein S18 acetylase RimI-like enzyme